MEDCSICFDKITEQYNVFTCKHSFHKNCIDLWLIQNVNAVCPYCRSPKAFNQERIVVPQNIIEKVNQIIENANVNLNININGYIVIPNDINFNYIPKLSNIINNDIVFTYIDNMDNKEFQFEFNNKKNVMNTSILFISKKTPDNKFSISTKKSIYNIQYNNKNIYCYRINMINGLYDSSVQFYYNSNEH